MPGKIGAADALGVNGSARGSNGNGARMILIHAFFGGGPRGLDFTTLFCRNYYIKSRCVIKAGAHRRAPVSGGSPQDRSSAVAAPILIGNRDRQFTGLWNDFCSASVSASAIDSLVTAGD